MKRNRVLDLEALKSIVKNHQHAHVNRLDVDAQTANTVLTVYNNLNEKNRAIFESYTLPVAVGIAFKLLERGAMK